MDIEPTNIVIVYCTFPATGENSKRAEEIAQLLIEERLAACVNVLPHVRSFYRWKGEPRGEAEQLAMIKTTAERFEALRARILALHPYERPEVVAVPLSHGDEAYLRWVRDAIG